MRFLLVDRIVELVSGERAVGIKNVTMSEDFFTHHFPDRPVMPGVLILEAFTQLGDMMIREQTEFVSMGVLETVSNLKLRRIVAPGDQLLLELNVATRTEEQVSFKGQARVGQSVVCSIAFGLRLQPLEQWELPERARTLYRMLRNVYD